VQRAVVAEIVADRSDVWETSDAALCAVLGALSARPAFANLVSNGGLETENLDTSGNPIPPPPGWLISGKWHQDRLSGR
jgi:hypothetical protein